MYKLTFGEGFSKAYAKLTKAEQTATDRKLETLAQNPWHPSLRIKRIRGTSLFECSVNMDIRMAIKFYEDTIIILLDIDHHDTLIRRIKRRG
jgi:mRNA-degrading endonuclease YafQ of YafQ-DinJ toxin-antitoxin module